MRSGVFSLVAVLLHASNVRACASSRNQKKIKDPGFDLLFQTDTAEYRDVPIHFDTPTPPWLTGTLIRNGLGQFEMGKRVFTHAFDGFAKLSSFQFHTNGTASFSSRFLKTAFYKRSRKRKTIAPYLLFQGVLPPFSFVERLQALARGIDNMNVNVYRLQDGKGNKTKTSYVALNDFWKFYRFRPHDLSTVSAVTPRLKGVQTSWYGGDKMFLDLLSSSHPLPEPGTNNHLTFLASVSLLPYLQDSRLRLVRIRGLRKRELVVDWPVERVPYMHSFSVTQHYAILIAQPFFVNVARMLETAQPFRSLDWEPQTNATIYIIRLSDGKLQELTTEAVFTMHHVNAYEDEVTGHLVVDVSAYDSPDFVASLQLDVLRDPVRRDQFNSQAHLRRYHLSLGEGKVSWQVIKGSERLPYCAMLDMPVINEDMVRSRHYCFVYGLVLKWDNVSLASIAVVKKDLCNEGQGDAAWHLNGHYPVEPWFQPSPEASKEDDGLVLVPVLDGKAGHSYLLVLDAANMTEVARAPLPTYLPYSLHGRFFTDLV